MIGVTSETPEAEIMMIWILMLNITWSEMLTFVTAMTRYTHPVSTLSSGRLSLPWGLLKELCSLCICLDAVSMYAVCWLDTDHSTSTVYSTMYGPFVSEAFRVLVYVKIKPSQNVVSQTSYLKIVYPFPTFICCLASFFHFCVKWDVCTSQNSLYADLG